MGEYSPLCTAKVSVWWDIENCNVPSGLGPHGIARNVCTVLQRANLRGPISISAYGDTQLLTPSIQLALTSTGIQLHHIPSGRKDASDKAILVDMIFWALDNPPPAHILLISGDRDFANALHRLRMKTYNILLALPLHVHVSSHLRAAASSIWYWSSLARGEGTASFPVGNQILEHGSSSLRYGTADEAIVVEKEVLEHGSSSALRYVAKGEAVALVEKEVLEHRPSALRYRATGEANTAVEKGVSEHGSSALRHGANGEANPGVEKGVLEPGSSVLQHGAKGEADPAIEKGVLEHGSSALRYGATGEANPVVEKGVLEHGTFPLRYGAKGEAIAAVEKEIVELGSVSLRDVAKGGAIAPVQKQVLEHGSFSLRHTTSSTGKAFSHESSLDLASSTSTLPSAFNSEDCLPFQAKPNDSLVRGNISDSPNPILPSRPPSCQMQQTSLKLASSSSLPNASNLEDEAGHLPLSLHARSLDPPARTQIPEPKNSRLPFFPVPYRPVRYEDRLTIGNGHPRQPRPDQYFPRVDHGQSARRWSHDHSLPEVSSSPVQNRHQELAAVSWISSQGITGPPSLARPANLQHSQPGASFSRGMVRSGPNAKNGKAPNMGPDLSQMSSPDYILQVLRNWLVMNILVTENGHQGYDVSRVRRDFEMATGIHLESPQPLGYKGILELCSVNFSDIMTIRSPRKGLSMIYSKLDGLDTPGSIKLNIVSEATSVFVAREEVLVSAKKWAPIAASDGPSPSPIHDQKQESSTVSSNVEDTLKKLRSFLSDRIPSCGTGYDISLLRKEFELAWGIPLDPRALGFGGIRNLLEHFSDIVEMVVTRPGLCVLYVANRSRLSVTSNWEAASNRGKSDPSECKISSFTDSEKFLGHCRMFLQTLLEGKSHGYPQEKLYKKFKNLYGCELDHQAAGYANLDDLLSALTEVVQVEASVSGQRLVHLLKTPPAPMGLAGVAVGKDEDGTQEGKTDVKKGITNDPALAMLFPGSKKIATTSSSDVMRLETAAGAQRAVHEMPQAVMKDAAICETATGKKEEEEGPISWSIPAVLPPVSTSVKLVSLEECPLPAAQSLSLSKLDREFRRRLLRDSRNLLQIILPHHTGGYPLSKLPREFDETYGYPLDFKAAGYAKLHDFLGNFIDFVRVNKLPHAVLYLKIPALPEKTVVLAGGSTVSEFNITTNGNSKQPEVLTSNCPAELASAEVVKDQSELTKAQARNKVPAASARPNLSLWRAVVPGNSPEKVHCAAPTTETGSMNGDEYQFDAVERGTNQQMRSYEAVPDAEFENVLSSLEDKISDLLKF